MTEQWLTMALEGPRGSSFHSGISFLVGLLSCLCLGSCLTDVGGLGEPSEKPVTTRPGAPSGKTAAKALPGSAEARKTRANHRMPPASAPASTSFLLRVAEHFQGDLADGFWCSRMEIKIEFRKFLSWRPPVNL